MTTRHGDLAALAPPPRLVGLGVGDVKVARRPARRRRSLFETALGPRRRSRPESWPARRFVRPQKIDPKNEAIAIGAMKLMITARRSLKKSCRSLRTMAEMRCSDISPASSSRSATRNTSSSADRPLPAGAALPRSPLDRVVADDPAVVDDDDPIGQPLGFFHVVRGVEERLPARLQLSRFRRWHCGSAGRRRPWARRAAGCRVVQQAGGEVQAPLHAAAERADAVARAVGRGRPAERRRNGVVERGADSGRRATPKKRRLASADSSS